MGLFTHTSALHIAKTEAGIRMGILKTMTFFLLVLSILSFNIIDSEFVSPDRATANISASYFEQMNSQQLMLETSFDQLGVAFCNSSESSLAITTVMDNPYFVLEEIPGKFRMIKAVFSDYELILRPNMLEYLTTDSEGEFIHLEFEECNQNIQPDGVNLISSKKMPIKNKAMAEVLKATTMDVSIYEKVVYKNIYNHLDLELSFNHEGGIHAELIENKKGAASKFNLNPRVASSECNTSQNTISFAKSNKSLKIKSDNNQIDFVEKKGFKMKSLQQDSQKLSFDINIK